MSDVMATVDPCFASVADEGTFLAKWKHIEEQAQAAIETARAKGEQRHARLLFHCVERLGWTQQRTGELIGKKQQWISYRLRFGRFLDFTTTVVKRESPRFDGLTEGRFRHYWSRTDKTASERERFYAVVVIIDDGIPQGREAQFNKPGVRDAIIDVLEDGKWYTQEQILASLEDKLLGITGKQVTGAVENLCARPPKGRHVERHRIGPRRSQYRLVDAKRTAGIVARVKPKFDELLKLSSHRATYSPLLIQKIVKEILDVLQEIEERN